MAVVTAARGTVKSRIASHVMTAWWYAAGFSLLAGILFAMTGGRGFGDLEVTFGEVVASYFAGATIAGAIVGLLAPLTATRAGSCLVGTLAAWPVMVAAATTLEGNPLRFDGVMWTATIIVAIAYGVGGTFVLRSSDRA